MDTAACSIVISPTTKLTRSPAIPSKTTSAILASVEMMISFVSPIEIRVMNSTSAGLNGAGGIKKSIALIPVPLGVVTDTRPEPV